MLLNERDEIMLRIAAKRGNTKSPVMGKEAVRIAIEIGEVTASPARHQDFLADPVRSFEDDDVPPMSRGGNRTHKAGGAATNDEDIDVRHAARIAGGIQTNEAVDGFLVQLAGALQRSSNKDIRVSAETGPFQLLTNIQVCNYQ